MGMRRECDLISKVGGGWTELIESLEKGWREDRQSL